MSSIEKKDNSRIVFISDSYPPSIDATSALNADIIEKISERNEITLILPSELRETLTKKTSLFKREGNKYTRLLPIPFAKTKSKGLKIIKFLAYAGGCWAYVMLKRHPRNTYIIHSSPPINIPLFAILIACRNLVSRKRRRSIAYIHDLYPDIVQELTKTNAMLRLIYRVTKRIYSISYNSFDAVITCSESISKVINKNYDVPKRNIITIWNWSLTESVEVKEVPIRSREKGGRNPIYCIGNFGILHMPEDSIDLLSTIAKNTDQKINLYLRGTHARRLNSRFKEQKNNVRICKYMTLEELKHTYLTENPITFVSLNRKSSLYAFPSRIATAISLGSPIIFFSDDHEQNPISRIICREKIGVCLKKTESSAEIEKKILEVKINYKEYSLRCIEYYKAIMCKEKNIEKITSLIKSLE
ncbi:glycosyltransferase [Synechococcus sp. UW105]|uniref:glycosyltransferase n=1 Tax=Synechococcus sp. UW105 TaxID=337067 RepID=UPI000E0EB06C|nr:glycosyltransferase [Synechococcus sp. UW105]